MKLLCKNSIDYILIIDLFHKVRLDIFFYVYKILKFIVRTKSKS